jgi:hypothetical protein
VADTHMRVQLPKLLDYLVRTGQYREGSCNDDDAHAVMIWHFVLSPQRGAEAQAMIACLFYPSLRHPWAF